MFRKFSDIGQFRNVIRDVQDTAKYHNIEKLPIVEVNATEKIHGTNACVGMDSAGNMFVQSRNNIITVDNDNAGCAMFVEDNKEAWSGILLSLALNAGLSGEEYDYIYVYFEWCGGNIQDNTAVKGLDKRAIIFSHYRVVKGDASEWFYTGEVEDTKSNIFNINTFNSWTFDIDFNNPLLSQNGMIDIVEKEIEPNSPLGNAFGISGNIGEGIVCTFTWMYKLYKFKVKGEKHSKSKVKKLKVVDETKEQVKVDFANYATPAWRLEQALDTVCGIGDDKVRPENRMIGNFIKVVMQDVIKEESDILEEKGLTNKEVNPMIAKIARIWFMEQI